MLIRKDNLKSVSNNDERRHRVHQLSDGDMFTVNNVIIQYLDKKFYEVVEYEYKYHGELITSHRLTGKIFTIEEITEIANKFEK